MFGEWLKEMKYQDDWEDVVEQVQEGYDWGPETSALPNGLAAAQQPSTGVFAVLLSLILKSGVSKESNNQYMLLLQWGWGSKRPAKEEKVSLDLAFGSD